MEGGEEKKGSPKKVGGGARAVYAQASTSWSLQYSGFSSLFFCAVINSRGQVWSVLTYAILFCNHFEPLREIFYG